MNRFRNILIGVLFPILGVVGFQMYWLLNAYNINEQRFEKDMHVVLSEALLNEYAVKLKEHISERQEKQDTIATKAYFSIEDNAELAKSVKVINTNDVSLKSNPELRQKIVSLLQKKKKSSVTITDTSFMYYVDYVDSVDSPSKDKLINNVLHIVGKLVKRDVDIDSLKTNYLALLEQRDIKVELELGVFRKGELLQSSNDSASIFEESENIIVFREVGSYFDEIRIYTPSKTSFLLQQMLLTILASILLVFIVVGSFFYMLNTILRQKKLSEIKNDFINNMTHEFKTPIATVSAALESVLDFGVIDNKKTTKEYLKISQKELKSLNNMVEKVLYISAYERNRVAFNPERLEISEILKEEIERYKVKHGGLKFEQEEVQKVTIFGDRMHIRNIISNLFDNAVKYSNGLPIIKVNCYPKENSLMLRVKDSGIGISKEQQKQIFNKFYRAPGDKMLQVKGFGLGLSYVKQVVEEHQGSISVQSAVDKGSEFIIQIPIKHEGN